jgi:mono/diheme cytochrome c family protein
MKQWLPPARSSVARVLATVLLLVTCLVLAMGGAAQTPATPSVWDGVFTAEQAKRGWQQFQSNCSACHGTELEGTADAKSLKGDRFWTDWKETTVDYMLERISQSMPFSEDGSLAGTLSEQTYVDVVAHILNTNGFPAGQRELSKDSSKGVPIIRKEGPGELPATALARIEGCLVKAADGWRLTKANAPIRVRGGAARPAASAANNREFALKFVLTPLDKLAGQRIEATGLLIGEGGKDGLNLSSTRTIAPTCE